MANLNLSQFTEKTFVADADWVFVWDTAGAISKKVSRNNWLNSGTLATSAPVTISQTWNGTGSTVFKALVVNATTPGTTSSASSLLLDLQVGGVSQFKVDKTGFVQLGGGGMAAPGGIYTSAVSPNLSFGWNNSWTFGLSSTGILGWTSSSDAKGAPDTILVRDGAANTLALRNGTNPQTFRVYNTYTDASNYERGVFGWASNELNIATGKSGSGLSRNILLAAEGALKIYTANSTYGWQFTTAGHFFFNADSSSDIGASGASRPRNVYVGTAVYSADFYGINSGLTKTYVGGAGTFQVVSTGVFAVSSSATNVFSADTYLSRNAAGVWQMGTSGTTANADLRLRSVIQQPPASITPASNGDYVVEATNNTTLTFRLKGSDGVVRSATLTLAP
jgi:hypothetical protein